MAEIAALRAELQVFQQQILKSFDSEAFKPASMCNKCAGSAGQVEAVPERAGALPISCALSLVFACVFVSAAVLYKPWACAACHVLLCRKCFKRATRGQHATGCTSHARVARQLVKLLSRQLLEQNNIKADDDVECKD
jgi:hypothetical protein